MKRSGLSFATLLSALIPTPMAKLFLAYKSTSLSRVYRLLNSHLLPILAFLAALNAILPAAFTTLSQQSLLPAISAGFGQSFVVWLSLGIAIMLWRRSSIAITNNRLTLLLAFLLSLGLLLPIATINWLICACCAALWLSQCRSASLARAAALLLLATALRDPVTKLLLTLFADQILSLDTWLTYLSLTSFESDSFSVQDNLISQAGGYDLLILTGCSAFVNLSLAMLLWLALSLLHKPQINSLDLIFACLVALSVVALNTARLVMMAIDQYWYQLLHEGDGATVIELAILLIASLPTIGRIYYEKYTLSTANFNSRTSARTAGKNH